MAAPWLIGRALLAGTAITAALASPAVATAEPTVRPASSVNLSVREGNAQQSRTSVLTCDPAGGTHPAASAACKSLAATGGDFHALRAENANSSCTLIYRPVTVTARGTWGTKPVNYQETFPNSCVMEKQTGKVFVF